MTEAEEENALIGDSGARGTGPDKLDGEWAEGETRAKPSSHSSTTAVSEEGGMVGLDLGSGGGGKETATDCTSAG